MVPFDVTETVVDEFEAVEIEEEDGELAGGVFAETVHPTLQDIEEGETVGEAGERIGELAVGDIGFGAGDAEGAAIAAADGGAADEDPAPGAIGVAHAEFGFEEVVALLHIGVERGAEAGGVFGMDAGVPVVDGAALL